MALNINTNMTSLLAVQGMNRNGNELSKTFQRLITGSRINGAGDDPAGFAVSTRLSSRIRGSNVAIRNVQDAVSVTQVADAAMQETMNSLQKMHDLVVSAGGAGVSPADRTSIMTEVKGLIAEIQRIATGTKFNDRSLLGGSYSGKIQVGADHGNIMSVAISGTSVRTLGVNSTGTSLASIGEGITGDTLNQNISTDLQVIAGALNKVSTIRAKLGAVQNRLNGVINGLNSVIAATTESNSRITDTDIASEVAAMTRDQIKQQVGAAVLAQANQVPISILTLLK
ncbi:MAG: flagellin FliC [Magnetococcus sp. DMHC-8]